MLTATSNGLTFWVTDQAALFTITGTAAFPVNPVKKIPPYVPIALLTFEAARMFEAVTKAVILPLIVAEVTEGL